MPRLSKALLITGLFVFLSLALFVSTFNRDSQEPGISEHTDLKADAPEQFVQFPTTSTLAFPSVTELGRYSSIGGPKSTATTTATTSEPTSSHIAATPTLVQPGDVALILKTGSNNVWRRLPLHLLTTFANGRIPNYAIYSDAVEKLPSGIETIDVIANITHLLQNVDVKAYDIYVSQQAALKPNVYREQVGLPGDTVPEYSESGNPEGWILDRYKFLPMLSHAYHTWPDVKWYFYIEDDTYIFWENILQWLSKQDHTEIAYHGAISGPSNRTFAQGGSGIAFSNALMREVFASDRIASLETYGNLTAQSCCGDVILGDILRDYGIKVNRGEFGTLLFRPEPAWKTAFDVAIWCDSILTAHHLHQQDIAGLALLEQSLLEENVSLTP
jgi:hypothetical protein